MKTFKQYLTESNKYEATAVFEKEVQEQLPNGGSVRFEPYGENYLEIEDITANSPGRGWGTKAMKIITSLADDNHINLMALPRGKPGTGTHDRLAEFYERFGFEDAGDGAYHRESQAPFAMAPEGIDTNGDNLYHVTLSRYVPKIRKLGLVPMGSDSNWTTGDGKRYGNGEVYAFQTLKDAVNWASDWDWSLTSSWGSGKISIVVFKRDSEEWESDDNDTLSQSGKQKPWLKRMNTVNPSEIVDVIPLSQDLVVDTLRG